MRSSGAKRFCAHREFSEAELMPHQHSIFKGNPDLDDPIFFEHVMAAIAALDYQGVHFVLMSDEHSETTGLHQMTWQVEDDELTELTLIKDSYADTAYVSVRSPKSWLVQRIIEVFSANIETYTNAELFQIARTNLSMQPAILYQLALVSRKFDSELAQILSASLDHRLPAVRYYAARAMAATQWHHFGPDLELALKMENDADVREMAEYALSVCVKEQAKSKKITQR